MFPVMLIAIGVTVLVFGSRLAVLGAAVGALLGVGILHFLPGAQAGWLALIIPIGLAILGALGAGFMKGIVNIATLVLGALAGAAIVLGVLDLFGLNFGLLDWLLALVGGVIGVILVRRFKNWAIVILAGLIGALLTMRGVQILLPSLQGPVATLLLLALAGGGIAYQGGLLGGRKPTADSASDSAADSAADQ